MRRPCNGTTVTAISTRWSNAGGSTPSRRVRVRQVSPSEIIERIGDDGEQLRPAVVLAVLPERGAVFEREQRDTLRPGAYLLLDRMNSKRHAGMIRLAVA